MFLGKQQASFPGTLGKILNAASVDRLLTLVVFALPRGYLRIYAALRGRHPPGAHAGFALLFSVGFKRAALVRRRLLFSENNERHRPADARCFWKITSVRYPETLVVLRPRRRRSLFLIGRFPKQRASASAMENNERLPGTDARCFRDFNERQISGDVRYLAPKKPTLVFF